MKTKKYDFYADQAHGWLKVKRSELIDLNILSEITGYSYQKNDYVYLEEDQDLSTFIRAMEAKNVQVQFMEHYSSRESRIRYYNNFQA